MSSVGQAVTGVVGGVAGYFLGGPAGAFKGAMLGFSVGLTLGGILFPANSETSQPRPMNLQIQTSQVGLAIPVEYGSRKRAGNLIWYGAFIATEQTSDVGGGSNTSTTVTTGYSYSVSMAWGICMAPEGRRTGIVNCWAGKNLVDPSLYRVYDGSQTEPDPYLATDPTTDRHPVWKNLCYVVMQDYPLGASAFIPQFTFEVAISNEGLNRADKNSDGFVADGYPELYGTDVWYSSGLDRVVALSSYNETGIKQLCGVFICDPNNLDIDKAYTSATDPGYSAIFKNNHRWPHSTVADRTSKWIPVLAQDPQVLMMINGDTDEIKYISFADHTGTYGISKNVSGLEGVTGYFVGIPFVPGPIWAQHVESEGRIYFLLNNQYLYAATLAFGYVEFNSGTTSYAFTSTFLHQYYDVYGDLCYYRNTLYIPENKYLALNFTTLYGEGRLLIGEASGGEGSVKRLLTETDDGQCKLPPGGITSLMAWHGGKIWGGITYDGVPTSPETGGLVYIDIDSFIVLMAFAPTFADDTNYGFDYIVPYGDSLLMGSSKYGIVTYNTSTYVWGHHDNTTDPGLDPTGDYNDFPVVGYGDHGQIYAGSFYALLQGWSGVVMIGGYSAGDVNPVDVSTDILTNDLYGLGLSESYLNDTENAITRAYCDDNDLLVALDYDTQISVLDALAYLLQHHAGYMAYYDGLLTHGQLQFTTPTQTVSDANNDFVEEQDFPVQLSKAGEREYYNRINVEWTKRDDTYSIGTATADDLVDIDTYRLKDTTIKLDGLCVYARAEKMAWLYLKKSILQPQTLTFPLGPKSKLKAIPGAIIYVTDSHTETSLLPVRISSIGEDESGRLEITGVEENPAIYDWDLMPNAEAPTPVDIPDDPAAGAESVQHTVAVEAPPIYTDFAMILLSSSKPADNDSWAGCSTYEAYTSGGSYIKKKTSYGTGIVGVVDSIGVEGEGTAYIVVVLDTDSTLSSATSFDAFMTTPYQNIFYVQGKGFGRFQTCELTGTNTWKLTNLLWDTVNFPKLNTYGSIEADDLIAFFSGVFTSVQIPAVDLYKVLYFKQVSFNLVGVEQSISEAIAIPVQSQNLVQTILPPYDAIVNGIGLDELTNSVNVVSGEDVVIEWATRNKSNTGGTNYANSDAIPEDPLFTGFTVEIYSDSELIRSVTTTDKTWTYTAAMQTEDSASGELQFIITEG